MTDKIGQLFKKYGIKSITMDDIARELGMSKKPFISWCRKKTNW
jgi:AcrR family transcriptional regulator